MLPSSHSFRGRWTCRSTARIKLGRERLRLFDGDRVSDIDRPALDHPRDHAPPSVELAAQALPDLVHPKTGLADRGYLQHGTPAEAHPRAGRQPHDVDAYDGDVLLDRAGEHPYRVERLLVGEQDLP